MTSYSKLLVKKNLTKDNLPSKLSKCQKSKSVEITERNYVVPNNVSTQRKDIWSVDSILFNIFTYIDIKDLIKLNIVCKRWNHISNPITHKSIKLKRTNFIRSIALDNKSNKDAKNYAEVGKCIASNAKFAPFVKEINFNEALKPQRAIELFETFRFITNLTIESVEMTQDQFLCMINPLTMIEELNLKYLNVNRIVKNRLHKHLVQLPSTLKKLSLENINLIKFPELFVLTINSHKNLNEFICKAYNDNDFLYPFSKSYPSLKRLEYNHQNLENPQILFNIIEFNPQLIILKLELSCWNNNLTTHISHHLANLEEFSFLEIGDYRRDYSNYKLNFSQPTKIKRLSITSDILNSCSLESILLKCPYLEEFSLNLYPTYLTPDPHISLNLKKPVKIKKLNIRCDNLSISSLDCILASCSSLKDLDIQLPKAWEEWIHVIGTRCKDLGQLSIFPSNQLNSQETDLFYHKVHETDLLAINSISKSILTNSTLMNFISATIKN